MSILSDIEIKEAMAVGEIEVYNPANLPLYVGPSSLDLHLDNKAMILDKDKFVEGEMMSFAEKEKSADKFTAYDGWDELIIYPGEFYILSSVEKIKFADNVVGFIQGRSSIARMGINIHAAGYFDAGFEGTATLEVTNFTNYPIKIPKHTRICQMVFARTGKPAEIPYSKKKDSKYQGQSGPTITSIHKDY
jgi:dCTP deaminase